MTDISGWTDEQVNEAVFRKHGGDVCEECGKWINFDGDEYPSCPDYTHSWNLCGELLEEMPPCQLWHFYECDWGIVFGDTVIVTAPTPQRAICEAWLAWKEQG